MRFESLMPRFATSFRESSARLAVLVLMMGYGVLIASGAHAQRVPETRAQIQLSFAPIVERAAPAVVNVYATRMVTQRPRSPFANDPFFRRFFGDDAFGGPAPRRRQTSNLGSGVIVDPSGIIVTNHHVVEQASAVRIALADKREFDATIILKDERTDLAILQIDLDGRDAERFPHLPFADSDALAVGDLVLAIGNPFGVGQTVTSGIVSALARTRVGVSDYQFFIQTDAAINPGNSGGALVDMQGRLIGINTAIFSRSGGSNGIGFAIPANMVNVVVAASEVGDVVMRPWLGARFQNVTSDIADSLGLNRPRGALVTGIVDDGPFDRAGIRVGDLILRMDGDPLADPDELGYRLATKPLGTQATFVVRSGRERRRVRITLAPPPETVPRDERTITGRVPMAGATVANLSPAVAQEMGFAENDGVVVIAVEPGSIAARYRFRIGDIILSVNRQTIRTSHDLERLMRRGGRLWRFSLERDGRLVEFVVRG